MQSLNVSQMAPTGTLAQTVMTYTTSQAGVLNVDTESQPFSLAKHSAGNIGAAIVFGYNLFKSGEIANDEYVNWCCASNEAGSTFVDNNTWYDNRDARRNIPEHYKARVFYDAPVSARDIRALTIDDLSKD